MHAQDRQLDEVIVVAYGEQKKSSFTGSAGVVDSKSLEKRQVNNVMDALQGNVTSATSMIATGLEPNSTYTLQVWAYADVKADKTTSPIATLTATTNASLCLLPTQCQRQRLAMAA